MTNTYQDWPDEPPDPTPNELENRIVDLYCRLESLAGELSGVERRLDRLFNDHDYQLADLRRDVSKLDSDIARTVRGW